MCKYSGHSRHHQSMVAHFSAELNLGLGLQGSEMTQELKSICYLWTQWSLRFLSALTPPELECSI